MRINDKEWKKIQEKIGDYSIAKIILSLLKDVNSKQIKKIKNENR